MKAAADTAIGTVNQAVRAGVATGAATAVTAGKAAAAVAPKAAALGLLAL